MAEASANGYHVSKVCSVGWLNGALASHFHEELSFLDLRPIVFKNRST